METLNLTPQALTTLRNASAPQETKSYVPIMHGDLIDYVKERVDRSGLKVITEKYSHNKSASQMFGEISIGADDTEMRMAIGFRNSTDKSLPVGFVAGTQVIVCSNLMLRGDIKQVRRHTTNILPDMDDKFTIVMENIDGVFKSMKHESMRMKEQELKREKAQQLFGKILLERSNVASIQQTTKAIDLFRNPLHDFGNTNVWGFYNAFTEVFKEAHPWNAPNNYLNLHKFLRNEFKFD